MIATIRKLFANRSARRPTPRPRLGVESLEDRRVPAGLVPVNAISGVQFHVTPQANPYSGLAYQVRQYLPIRFTLARPAAAVSPVVLAGIDPQPEPQVRAPGSLTSILLPSL